MATTTNYGWTTPNDTDLVKDGASAIRTLGSSIDTTTKALNPSTTLGDIEYRSSTANTNTRLGIGTSGQVLAVSSGVPAWTTISSGGMTLISETVASANSSISLSSIPQTYKKLRLEWGGIFHSASGSIFPIRLNANSSYVYQCAVMYNVYGGSFNSNVFLSTNVAQETTYQNATAAFGNNVDTTTEDPDRVACGFFEIDDYTSTTKFKTFNGRWGHYNTASGSMNTSIVGTFQSTSAVTSLDIVRLNGSATLSNRSNTSIRLYGIS